MVNIFTIQTYMYTYTHVCVRVCVCVCVCVIASIMSAVRGLLRAVRTMQGMGQLVISMPPTTYTGYQKVLVYVGLHHCPRWENDY